MGKRRFARMRSLVWGMAVCMSMGIGTGAVDVYAGNDSDTDNSASFSTDVIYQIVTDRFVDGDSSNNPTGDIFDKNNMKKYHGGDWAGIEQKIEDGYLTGMGVTAIWISSPVENIMVLDPSNNCASYHGYWAKDFFQTNEAFGTEEDFVSLLETAHENGIKVVIDFAPNHTSTAEYAGYTFPEDGSLYKNGTLVGSFSNDTQGIFNHESWTDYSTYEHGIYHSMYGLADLNQLNNTVDSYLKEAVDYWLDLGVDGLRVDAVKHMPSGWQTNWLSGIYEEHPVFVFGEWFSGGTGNDADMTKFANESGMSLLDFRYANAVRNALGNDSGTMKDLYAVMEETAADYDEVLDQVTFIDNHDMSRFMTLANGNARDVENAYVLLMTSRGVPTIYYGSEQYATGASDPDNRGDMTSFNTSSTAYRVISALSPLRKNNPAAAYGTTLERWANEDVLIYERQFGDSVILTAVNRNQNKSYNISGLYSSLPAGIYQDVMGGLLSGNGISVDGNGYVTDFTLGAGASAVWQYTAESEAEVSIGNVDPGMGIAGNQITITGNGFGENAGSVMFGTTAATVEDWSDSRITVTIPSVAAGEYTITVTNAAGSSSGTYAGFSVLTGEQTAVRFVVNNAQTDYGTNVYLVGNVYELGNWDTAQAVGPGFNATASIGSYPTWFFDVNVPAGATIEYKFVKIDGAGNVTWESGDNHIYTVPADSTGKIEVNWQ